MKILQRLLVLFLLSSATAFAQLSSTITIQRNFSISPNANSYADISAGCPAGYVALSGGVDGENGDPPRVRLPGARKVHPEPAHQLVDKA